MLDRDSQIESAAAPYISLVVAARNDDHGGNLLGRMQIFVNGWLEQARRYRIPSELIIVEWNPPADRPPLAEALSWPADHGFCEVRIIEVSRETHANYKHGKNLALYQMIAKNVGIRRARGRFILATNLDILFSDELAAFIGRQELRADRMYRIDRHDVMSDVPPDARIGEQLAYCRNHLIRVNRRDGTFEVTPDGSPVLSVSDIASPESGILPGAGWFSPEQFGPLGCFRWAQEKVEILLKPGARGQLLTVDIEPGPATGGLPLNLSVLDDAGHSLAKVAVESRTRLRLSLPSPLPERVWLQASGTFSQFGSNPRTLCFRVFGLRWESGSEDAPASVSASRVRTGGIGAAWRSLQYLLAKLAHGGPLVPVTIPVSPRMQRYLKTYVGRGGLTGMILGRKQAAPVPEASVSMETVKTFLCPEFLHTNGCGDFTLIARERWADLRAYPEMDVFSMNIDSVFCLAAHYGGAREEVLADPMRIYHIEHGTGSGWTPEGQKKLFDRIGALGIPILDNEEVLQWGAQMRRLDAPLIFNHDDWGLAAAALREMVPVRVVSEIPSERMPLDERELRVKPTHHAAFERVSAYTGPAEAGFQTDFLGIRTRCEFLSGAATTAVPVHTAGPHEDYLEWIDLLESILSAKDKFTMMELGAGYGRWSVRAAAVLRQLRDLPFHLVAVEAEPKHYRWLQQHFSDNHIDAGSSTLLRGVVAAQRGAALFYVGSPAGEANEAASWYGQAIAGSWETVDDSHTDLYEDEKVFQLRSGWKSIRVPSFTLEEILPDAGRIDLIDLDVQGEELNVIAASIEALDRRAARLHIGTHSTDIEKGLKELLGAHGWSCIADYAGGQINATPWGAIDFVDGVQTWVNPRLL
ncbi:MAG TPA: FkbM family methyltransferase [Bryobacteraceae bacterium]